MSIIKNRLIDFSDFSSGVNYDENITNSAYATEGYNFNFTHGKLNQTYGVKPLNINCFLSSTRKTIDTGTIAPVLYFSYMPNATSVTPLLVVVDSQNKVYTDTVSNVGNNFELLYELDGFPRVIRYFFDNNNYLIFSTQSKLVVYSGDVNTSQSFQDTEKIFDIASSKGVLYLVKDTTYRNALFYSRDLNPLNIQSNLPNMSSISLPEEGGNVIKLLDFDNYLYIFCEYAIYRLVIYENKKNTYLETIYCGTGMLWKDSISLAGSRIVFATSDGIYICNGLKASKMKLNIEKIMKNTNVLNVRCVYSAGKYFIACNLSFDDLKKVGCENLTRKNSSLLVVDIEKEKAIVCRGVGLNDINIFANYNEYKVQGVSAYNVMKPCEIDENGNYCIGSAVEKYWKTSFRDLGDPDKFKLCKKIYLKTKTDIGLTVFYDNKNTIFNVSGSNELQCIRMNLKAKKFALAFNCTASQAEISDVKMVVDVYD